MLSAVTEALTLAGLALRASSPLARHFPPPYFKLSPELTAATLTQQPCSGFLFGAGESAPFGCWQRSHRWTSLFTWAKTFIYKQPGKARSCLDSEKNPTFVETVLKMCWLSFLVILEALVCGDIEFIWIITRDIERQIEEATFRIETNSPQVYLHLLLWSTNCFNTCWKIFWIMQKTINFSEMGEGDAFKEKGWHLNIVSGPVMFALT